jgi:uncharacterized protein YyaL (SSP411 family)
MKFFLIFISLIFFVTFVQAQVNSHENQLYNHPSPYLAMHGQDPVNWLIWQKSVLKKAQVENKLIMISSGYFSCHWCHVMQKHNYHDQKTARYLNQHFLSVKIDRELTPDLDRYLVDFAQRAAGHAGWPQHVFLTPEGYPFFAFTYKPNPDFLLNLQKIQTFWQNSPNKILTAAKSAIKQTEKPPVYKLKLADFQQSFLQQLQPQMDMLSGGLKGSNKFPNASILKSALLITNKNNNNNNEIIEWLKTTLDQMQSQHLFDHVYGGFYRYTIDPEWQTPHFEKMLYTQAQLAKLYLIAGKKFNRQDYLTTGNKTLQYVQQRLFHPPSGLYKSSQSAVNKQQIEAGDYVWTKSQLKKLLSAKQYQQIKQQWLENQTPYTINEQPAWHPMPTDKYWQAIKQQLANSDIKPAQHIPTDSKSILGWNGLLLSAFAQAVQLKQLDSKIANNLANSLIKNLSKNQPPRAISATNTNMGRANIQDYAYIIKGLEDWASISKNNKFSKQAQFYRQQTKHKFFSKQGWLYSDSPLLPNQTGSWAMADSAIPSPTAILNCRLINRLQNNPLTYASYATAGCN